MVSQLIREEHQEMDSGSSEGKSYERERNGKKREEGTEDEETERDEGKKGK